MAPELKRIGPYEVVSELGRGGMGVVYRARHPELQREVALKVMLGGEHAGDEAYDRFVREARAAGGLRHANIVAVHDVGVHEGLPYIVMDFVPGKSLAGVLHDEDLPARRAVEVIAGIAEAMACAHASGIIHRDLKPGNILIDAETGRPMLTDFGLAREVSGPSGLTQSGATLGTPAYMSPEQARGEVVDHRADVYGLGAVLYEMLTGKPPFEAETPYAILGRVLRDEPPRVRSLTSAVSRDVELICETAMAKEVERRYPSADAMAADCHAWLAGDAISASAPSMMYLLQRRMKRHRVPILAGLVSLLLTAVLVFFFTIRPRLLEAQSDRTALGAALAAKEAREQQYRDLLAAGRYSDAIDGFRALAGTTPPIPEGLHDRRRAEEPAFTALHTPYEIDLAVAYYRRGLDRLESGDSLARGDLANAFHLARPGGDPSVPRGALVALANAQIDDAQWAEAARTAAAVRERFGTAAPEVRGLCARLLQHEGQLEDAAALWHAVREDAVLGARAQRQLEVLSRLLPVETVPDPGPGFRVYQPRRGAPLEAARLMPDWTLVVKRLHDAEWRSLPDVELDGTAEFGGAAIQVLDCDHDGVQELVCYANHSAPKQSHVVVVWRDGDAFRPTAGLTFPGALGGLSGGDLDGDGAPELVWHVAREIHFLTVRRDRLERGAAWQCISFIDDTDITPEGDLIVFFGPYLLAAGWRPTWNLRIDGLFLEAPDGSRVPAGQALPDGVSARWGYRVARYRHADGGWMSEAQELPERYHRGHVTRMPDGHLLVSARADARLTKILPERRAGVFRVPYGDDGFGAPVEFAPLERVGTSGWFPFPVGDTLHYATTYPATALRLLSVDGSDERVTGIRPAFQVVQLDDDPAPELLWRPDAKAGETKLRIAGRAEWSPKPAELVEFGSAEGADLRTGLTAEQQLYDSGLYEELAEVCRERIASGQGPRWNFELGRALSALERWDAAAEAYAAAAEDRVLEPRALLRRMHALEQLRDWKALAACCERLAVSPQAGPFATAEAAKRVAWVKPALDLPGLVEWAKIQDAPELLASTVLNAREDAGGVAYTSVRRYESAFGALVHYPGGPLKLRAEFTVGHLGPGPPVMIGLQRVDGGARYAEEPAAGLWIYHVGRGANDRPAVTWYAQGNTRTGARGYSGAEQEGWAAKTGDRAVLELEYVPGFNRVWAELRSPDGKLLLAFPPAQLPAPIEAGTYVLGVPGLRGRWDGVWDPYQFASAATLHGVRLQGAEGLEPATLEPVTPRLAVHLGNGRLLRGDVEGALTLFETADRLAEQQAPPDAEGLRMDAALGRAVAELRRGRPEAARTALQTALQHDGDRLRRLLTPPYMLALAPEEVNFFRAVAGG